MSTILVEDAIELAQVIAHELEGSGHGVLLAGNGESALKMHDLHQPDLVVLDWMLPDIDGLEVLRRLRQSSSVPILMLTARSEEVDRIVGLEVGADDHLTKPFSKRELIARVRALLRRVEFVEKTLRQDREEADKPISYETLRLDPIAHQVTLDSSPLELSRTELALLVLLLRNPRRAFNHEYLRSFNLADKSHRCVQSCREGRRYHHAACLAVEPCASGGRSTF